MRVVTWNCRMAFRKKAARVLVLKPDILVVPECEAPEIMQREPALPSALRLDAAHCAWIGNNPRKGLAVFALGAWELTPSPCDLTAGPIWCLPLHVSGRNGIAFDLMAVWSFYESDRRNRQGNPVVHGLEDFSRIFAADDLIVAGDFNSPIKFHSQLPSGFQRTDRELEARGLTNAYHAFTGESLGSASRKTFYLAFREHAAHHIDHVYVPRAWTVGMRVECGDYEPWVSQRVSDHVPLSVELDDAFVAAAQARARNVAAR